MRRGKQYIKSMNEILTVTSAGMERPSSEPLQLPDINIHRTNSASLAVSTNVRNSFSGSIGSVSVKSLTMQLQRGKEREALRARIAERSNNNNKLARAKFSRSLANDAINEALRHPQLLLDALLPVPSSG